MRTDTSARTILSAPLGCSRISSAHTRGRTKKEPGFLPALFVPPALCVDRRWCCRLLAAAHFLNRRFAAESLRFLIPSDFAFFLSRPCACFANRRAVAVSNG